MHASCYGEDCKFKKYIVFRNIAIIMFMQWKIDGYVYAFKIKIFNLGLNSAILPRQMNEWQLD